MNILDDVPWHAAEEVVHHLLHSRAVRIERIVSHGHVSPDGFWYDQQEAEWVLLVRGAARLRFEEETIELRPGDYIHIPARRRHRVEWTTPDEPTIWLAVFYPAGETASGGSHPVGSPH